MAKSLAIAYAMQKKKNKYAHGGDVVDAEFEDLDLVDKIIKKKMAHKQTVQEGNYDYLETGDLDNSTTNSGAAAGDFLGNKQQDKDRKDIVAKIMHKRKSHD